MSNKTFQILLIDDDQSDIELAEIQLRKIDMDLRIDSVCNRQEFEEFIDREPLPDLVICDYQLTEYDGEKALKHIRKLHSYLPFILVTGFLKEEEAVELMKKGATDIITKQRMERLGPAVQRELIYFRQRNEARIEQQQTEEKYRNIVEHSTNMFYQHNTDGILSYLSPQSKTFLGYSPEEALMRWTEFITDHPINKEGEAITQRAIETGEAQEPNELQLKTREGRIIWVEVNEAPLKRDGKVVGIVGSLTDITKRKEHEEKINRIYERFEKVTEATNDAIWDFDIQDDHLFWGKGFETLFGYDVNKIKPSFDFLVSRIHPDDRDRVIQKIDNYMSDASKTDWFEEYRFQRADGSYAYVMDRAVFIKNNNEEVTRVVGAMTDLTRQKEFEESLKQLNIDLKQRAKELAESNAELEQFAFVASHDLQEPLRMISGFLTQIEKKYDHLLDDKGRQYIHFATDGAMRMRQIILDLLEFSKVGRIDIERENVNLNELIEDTLSLNRKLISEWSAKIHVQEMPVIRASKGPMRQLFQNLVNNAVKYHEKGSAPVIDISWCEDEFFWHFEVRDNGIGINALYSQKIFNIFQRLHGKEEYSGSGMGLAISKKIVEEHGGRIGVKSENGKGSTFYFSIEKNQREIENAE